MAGAPNATQNTEGDSAVIKRTRPSGWTISDCANLEQPGLGNSVFHRTIV